MRWGGVGSPWGLTLLLDAKISIQEALPPKDVPEPRRPSVDDLPGVVTLAGNFLGVDATRCEVVVGSQPGDKILGLSCWPSLSRSRSSFVLSGTPPPSRRSISIWRRKVAIDCFV